MLRICILDYRSYATQSASVAFHRLSPEHVSRVIALPDEQRKEAIKLIIEDPVDWTPSKLATRFGVTTALIRATVPRPSRWQWKFHKTMSRSMTPFDPHLPRTPRQQQIDAWIREQQANTLKYREVKRRWRTGANFDLLRHLDLRWLNQIEHRLTKLQEQSMQKLAESRKKRSQA